MFTALVLTPDGGSAEGLQRLAVDSQQVSVQHVLAHYPQLYELVKVVNTYDPELVFLDLSDWDEAVRVASQIQSQLPTAAVIGFGGGWESGRETDYAKAGIATLLVSPVNLAEFQDGVARAIHAVRGAVLDNLLAFLPAKAGSGCTVTVLNVAGRLAGALEKKVLLFEGDLRSGVLSVLTKCSPESGMQEALAVPEGLNRVQWEQFVVNKHGIDIVMRSPSAKAPPPSWGNYYHFLRYVTDEYDVVAADLPEVVSEATQEIVRRARTTLIVCTPEAPSLGLARQRYEELQSLGADPSRIWFVLNRWHETDQSPKDAEAFLGHPVKAVIPNDYNAIRQATMQGALAPETSALGTAYLSLARKLAGVAEEAPPKGKFSLAAFLGR